jgi:hypothetical protein
MTIDPPNGSNPSNPNGDLSLWVAVNNSWTLLAMVPQPVSTGVWYHAKIDLIGSLVEGKVWPSGTAEPAWQITGTQTALPGAGQAGTRTTGAYVNWANFQQTPITQIIGTVTSTSNGAVIPGASVRLSSGAGTTTDAAGNFSFAGVVGGAAYTITVSATGYIASSVADVPTAGMTASANLTLSPTSSSKPGSSPLVVSSQIQNGITNNPGNGQTETDVTWSDASGSGWRVGTIPGYGGANIATWYEVDGGVVGPNQTALNTTNPGDIIHDFTQSAGGSYWGSESTPYAQTFTANSFRVSCLSTVPASGTDPNGFTHTVNTYIYPGNPGFMVNRFDITNPSSSPIQLSPTQSIEYDVISGLETADGTWSLANGGYGNIGGSPIQGWPSLATAANPDYFYILPAASSSVKEGVVAAVATKLSTLGLLNVQVIGESNSHRVKVVVYGNNPTFPANTTKTFYVLQAITRNLTAGQAETIAADYLSPDAPSMGLGTFGGFSYDEGLYTFTANNNVTTFTPTFSSTVQERWLDIYKVTGYTSTANPSVTLNDAPLASGIDYVSYVDTANQVAYVKLLKPLVPGSPASGQLQSGPITIGG